MCFGDLEGLLDKQGPTYLERLKETRSTEVVATRNKPQTNNKAMSAAKPQEPLKKVDNQS